MGFILFKSKPNCNEWGVWNKKNQFLGDIVYNGRLKQWVFYPDHMCFEHEIWFAKDCLEIIASKLDSLNTSKEKSK